MNNKIRLKWEPSNEVPMDEVEKRLAKLFAGDGTGVSILRNGTLLFINEKDDNVESARKAIDEARFLIDFRVMPIADFGFIVQLHNAVAVYVGKEEYQNRKAEIKSRIADLKFPSEEHVIPNGWSEDDYLVGLYGRGKLQKDAYDFNFYKRLTLR